MLMQLRMVGGLKRCVAVLAVGCGAFACGTEAGDGHAHDIVDADALEIVGSWESNFGGDEIISDDAWNMGYATAQIVAFDNLTNTAITQNASDAAYDPGKFNRLVWTDLHNDAFYYCTVDIAVASLELALASTTTADASDPENSGCGGFSWTKLIRKVE